MRGKSKPVYVDGIFCASISDGADIVGVDKASLAYQVRHAKKPVFEYHGHRIEVEGPKKEGGELHQPPTTSVEQAPAAPASPTRNLLAPRGAMDSLREELLVLKEEVRQLRVGLDESDREARKLRLVLDSIKRAFA